MGANRSAGFLWYYWINLYNALTIKLVLDHYPVASIRDISPGLFSFGPWDTADFGDTDAGVIRHLRRYAEPGLAAAIGGATRIADDRYDWALNDAARTGQAKD